MIIETTTPEHLREQLVQRGVRFHEVTHEQATYFVCAKKIEGLKVDGLAGYRRAEHVHAAYPLVSREWKSQDTVVDVAGVSIGAGSFVTMAGPCSVESETQLLQCAQAVALSGAQLLRGGAFKPRTSPYEFQGLGEEGLRILALAREQFGLGIVTEVMAVEDVTLVAAYADLLQVGARNMQHYPLLKALGKCGRPVLLKRGLSATLKELLMAAEYVVAHGNPNVILCERGIRTFETHTRNTFDIAAIPALRELTHLPLILDPSHASGRRSLIAPLAKAAVAVGADGLLVECHPDPDRAWSDGAQSLSLEEFGAMMRGIQPYVELRNSECKTTAELEGARTA